MDSKGAFDEEAIVLICIEEDLSVARPKLSKIEPGIVIHSPESSIGEIADSIRYRPDESLPMRSLPCCGQD